MKMIKISDLQEFGSTFFNDPILKLAINAAAANAPTVDAVEVVRCKDCKWYSPPGGVAGQKTIICSYQPKDFFCAYGERRTDA